MNRVGESRLFDRGNEDRRNSQLTEDQRKQIRQAFEVFDIGRDKLLDHHELRAAMKALGFDASKAEIQSIIRDNDHAGLRRINEDAFTRVMSAKILARDPKEEMRRAFALFDGSGTGKITFQDLKRVASEIDEKIDDEELRAMIDVFDLDEDGAISFEEFQNLCS